MSNKQQLQKYLSPSVIGLVWLAYGVVAALCMSHGYLLELGLLAYDHLGKFIPSVNRIDRIPNSGTMLAKAHASVMLASMPLLLVGFLVCEVEDSVSGVRKKAKETIAITMLVLIASLVFVAGFNHSIGRKSFASFSLLSTLITGFSAYCYRLAFCIATKR